MEKQNVYSIGGRFLKRLWIQGSDKHLIFTISWVYVYDYEQLTSSLQIAFPAPCKMAIVFILPAFQDSNDINNSKALDKQSSTVYIIK